MGVTRGIAELDQHRVVGGVRTGIGGVEQGENLIDRRIAAAGTSWERVGSERRSFAGEAAAEHHEDDEHADDRQAMSHPTNVLAKAALAKIVI